MTPEQELPFAPDAEKSILGAILLENDAIWEAGETLTTIDFALDSNQRLYSAMLRLAEEGKPVDTVTLVEELGPAVGSVGGVAYIFSLTEGLPRRLSIREYVRIVKQRSLLRQIIKKCSLLITEAHENGDAVEILTRMQGDAIEIASDDGEDAFIHVAAITQEVFDQIERDMVGTVQDIALGLTTGIPELDKHTKGLFPGELTIIAGEASGFKTALLTQILLANAKKKVSVGLFSIEMRRQQMLRRMASSIDESFTARQIRDPRLISMFEKDKLKASRAYIDTLPMWIDDTARIRLEKMKARARAAIRRHDIKLFGIDYLQLVIAEGKQADQKIEEAVFGCRDLAKDENRHVIALSQYSRDSSIGRFKKSGRSRLKGSSAIEQAAQNIFLVEADEPKDDEDEIDAQITIDKQREGGRKKVKCRLSLKHLTFKSVPPTHSDPG